MHPDGMQNAFEQAMKQRPTENYTPEEVNKFRDAFKDPEFRKMLAEYMADISDPKNRAEQEEYIRQLEGEGKVPEGKDLIKPKPGFAVKCHKVHKGVKDKLFINIVQSDRIQRPTSRPVPEKEGVMWSMPHALGPPRIEKDNRGSHVTTFDCCFHPEAVSKALMADAFKKLVVTTATDGVVKAFKLQGQTVEMAPEPFHLIRGVVYKTGEPAIMMVAKSQLSSPSSFSPAAVPSQSERLKQSPPADRSATSEQRDTTGTPVNSECKASVSVTAAPPPSGSASSAAASSSPTPPPTATPGTTAATRTAAEAAATKGPKEPTFSIVERGKVVLADHMVAHPDKQRVASTRPKELVIKIKIPLVKSASELEVNLSERRLLLTTTGGKYELDLALPYPVLEDEAAKFDKQRKVLTVTVPVRQEEPKAVPSFLPTTDSPLSEQQSASDDSTQASRTEQSATDSVDKPSTATIEAASFPAAERARETESRPGLQRHERWVDGSEEKNDRLVVDQAEVAKVLEETQRKRASEQEEQLKAKAHSSEKGEGPDAPCDVSRDARVVAVGPHGGLQALKEKDSEGGAESHSELPFIVEEEFRGQRAGYVFKAGSQGVGYYRDAAQTQAGGPVSSRSVTDTSHQSLDDQAAGRAVPPYKATQKETSFTLIVTVPDIDSGSVRADWGGSNGRMVTIDFEAAQGDGSTKQYHLRLNLAGRVDPHKCSFDVATRNMLVVLYKAEPVGHWSSLVIREDDGRRSGDVQYDERVSVPSETVHARTEARPTKNVQFQNRMMMDME